MSGDKIREGCCETWPKPCGYHEGYLDGLERGHNLMRPSAEEVRQNHPWSQQWYRIATWMRDQ